MKSINLDIENKIRNLLNYIEGDSNRQGLQDTPYRVIKSWQELYSGYDKSPKNILTTFKNEGYDEIILLKNIELYSMCEHHLLPFYGKAHVAYIPDEKIVGISKLARLVEIFARRMQIQERIGHQVTEALEKYVEGKGAACIIQATHMCMRMRGISKQNSTMVTSSMRGVFLNKQAARNELMELIRAK